MYRRQSNHLRGRRRTRGFTLLELVAVLVIVSIALAVAAPSLSGWRQGRELDAAVSDFLTATRTARMQAVMKGAVHRLLVDPQGRQYQLVVQSGEEFVPVDGAAGDVRELPGECVLEIVAPGPQPNGIEFHPDGRMEAVKVRIMHERGGSVLVECRSPAEGFVVAAQGGDL